MKEQEITRAGVIDIGTHSIKLFIAEKDGDDIKKIESLKNVAPLGNDTFFKERITQETMNKTIAILEKYSNKLKEYAITDIKIIATTAVREATNKDIFIDTVYRRTGFNIEVLTVGDVSYYIDAYLSQKLKDKYPIHTKNLIIAELGSGSLDVSVMSQGLSLLNIGMPLGTLRIKQLMGKLGGSMRDTFDAVEENVDNEFSYLKREIPAINIDDVVLIDETYSSYLQKILSKNTSDSFFKLSAAETQNLIEKIMNTNIEDLAREYKIPIENVDMFPPYAIILNAFTKSTEGKNIYILEVPLAEAVLADMLLNVKISQKYNKTNQLISIANSICKKFNADIKHARQVAFLSEIFFNNFKEVLGLKNEDLLYLLLASYLHDIGMFVYTRSHHKHSEYIILNLNLFRLNNEEIKIIACCARYHRKNTPAESHFIYNSLPKDKQMLIQKLSSILRLANALDSSHKQKVKKLEIKFNRNQNITLTVTVPGNFLLEKTDFEEKKILLEDISGNKLNLKIQYEA
ncbi:exopolyphosphatase [Candidatus Omnitrophus magneticus]|uniref:Exopolyphosphatase n=1 Tax=Candidatus Omnitrophus magneticus TaxID=1609969 RepID=A0A0F0CQI1_9BACT|nr:exopolyphosphatase [Candidatus Omnitrophus magneticus]